MRVTLDIETYQNYLLIMFRQVDTGKTMYFEKFNGSELNIPNVLHILEKYTIITFNGRKYDLPVIEAAVAGFSNKAIYDVSSTLIEENLQPWQARKHFGTREINCDHIDLIEVAPLKASLKIYGGRLHSPRMADLPLSPSSIIEEQHLSDMRRYCSNDLEVTELLYKQLEPEIELRAAMSKEYGVDLRSKSDAQIAEAVVKKEFETNYGTVPKRPKIPVGTSYRYKAPNSIVFHSKLTKELFAEFTEGFFVVGKSGHVELPESLKGKKFTIGETTYKIGIGGLHSCEKSVRHTNENYILRDYDVASYYPRIILNNKLSPKHLGKPFLTIYNSIVERRLKAKKEGDKITNESLKITINGSFGKFGSKWSCLYSPDLMMQVTLTGQLTLLMLIERLEDAGIGVVSANTDGIVTKIHPEDEATAEAIVKQWEKDTDYELESTDYTSLNSRDVNNYIAVKESGIKGKGAYSNQQDHYYKLRANPANDISTEAVKDFLQSGTPVEQTIRDCQDITRFLTVRTVNGGAIQDGVILGKAIRWYYGEHELDDIRYVTSGNKVPRSDGAVPLMDLPEEFPTDVDYDWYIAEAKKILGQIGL